MKKVDFEIYTEYNNYKTNLMAIKNRINDSKVLQFSGKAYITPQPNDFYTNIMKQIDDEIKRVEKNQEDI